MAPVGGVSSSNMSSLYGNRNVISGLASGMDTEGMIENAVSGIRSKISGLLQKQTKLGWKQEAYWNITDKLVQFSRKYSSYTSSTNLMSASFFNKAVTTITGGANASKVSATGKSTSDVIINGVAQLASASRYQVGDAGVLNNVLSDGGSRYVEGTEAVDLSKEIETSNLAGGMILRYGAKQTVGLSFSEDQIFKNADELAEEIKRQLADQTVSFSGGTSQKASDVIDVKVQNGKITFSDKTSGGNTVNILSASGELNETLGNKDYNSDVISTIDLSHKPEEDLKSVTTVGKQISGKNMTFTLDGSTKTITMPTQEEITAHKNRYPRFGTEEEAMVDMMNTKLNEAFGAGKVKVSLNTDGEIRFAAVQAGSNLSVNSGINKTLGMGEGIETTYLNTSKTLGSLLGENGGEMGSMGPGERLKSEKAIRQTDGTYRDAEGNKVDKEGYRLGKDGKQLYGYDLTINGKKIGTYTRDTALESIMVDIDANTQAGVSVNYSRITNQFVFNARETGAGHKVDIGGALGGALFGNAGEGDVKFDEGTDAIVNMTVNGTNLTINRSTNVFDVDGMSVTVGGTFNGKMDNGAAKFDFDTGNDFIQENVTNAVTFSTKADADKIVDAIKSFVKDYNEMVKAVRDGFATLPLEKSDKSKYEPLTDGDMEGMSESAIDNYNEKAKTGILFGDSDLSALYNKLTAAIAPSGADGGILKSMGINTDYSEGLTTIDLDEGKLREALNTNPDAVRDAFSKSAETGSSTNGIMVNMRQRLDTYVATEGNKGVLINKAGSKYSAASLLQNSIKTQVDNYDIQVDKWQTKLADKVDYYTGQFSRLEQLIAQMNSQSSTLMGMMGGNG